MKELKLTKVSIQESHGADEYATPDAALESIQTICARYDLPVLDALRIVSRKSVDTVTLGKDTPYVYFFARKDRDSISFRITEGSRTIRFELPLEPEQLETLRLRLVA